MRWLGLDWDGAPVIQFDRARATPRSRTALLASGHAYSASPPPTNSRRCAPPSARRSSRCATTAAGATAIPADGGDAPFVVRFRAPQTGEVTIDDRVQGDVTVANAELDDMVLLRSDGTPTYMLAVVVDDHDMGVTHVIRGDDHLNNAFRQLAMISALGWPEPVYAHIPLIHGADGAKLSKRHGALGVDAYRDELGMLPEAVDNYLLRLGWGHGDDEIISREQAIEWFDLAGVGRGPARFDLKKLENLNGHYIRQADDARLAALIAPRVESALGRALTDADRDLLQRGMAELKLRATDLNELAAVLAVLLPRRVRSRWTQLHKNC